MSALTVTLGADITALKRAMAGATELVAASARRMGRITGAGLAGIGRGGVAVLGKGLDLAGVAFKASIGAAMAGGAAAVGVGVKAVTAAANFEQTKVAFATLIGDAAQAEATLARLRELGAETPFEFPELADAGRKLIAFGESADSVPDTLRRIGDISAGVQAPVNDIAELYGKARVQGRLFAEDINQLTGRGIPIIQELARQFGVSDSEVKKLVETGKVGPPNIERAFIDMTSEGGKFSGMMAAQSKTTSGLFSTLKDTINEVFLTLGEPINDAIRPLISEAIGLVQKLTPLAREAGARIKGAVQFVIAAFKSGEVLSLIGASLKLGFAVGVNELARGMRAALLLFWNLITDMGMWAGLGKLMLGTMLIAVGEIVKAFESLVSFLAAGMEWVGRLLLQQLLKIPGMDKLFGFGAEDVGTDFGQIHAAYKSQDLFGGGKLGAWGADMAGSGAGNIAESFRDAASNAAMAAGAMGELIDTGGMSADLAGSIAKVMGAMTGGSGEAVGGNAAQKTASEQAASPAAATVARLAPIVTSLGKVGGGGYATGALDAQRENNRLTGETNRLLVDLNRRMEKLGGPGQAAFG